MAFLGECASFTEERAHHQVEYIASEGTTAPRSVGQHIEQCDAHSQWMDDRVKDMSERPSLFSFFSMC
jgi:demethoxyubiquinone hydroxylase (CLK1/Coq7/Cat5 family)